MWEKRRTKANIERRLNARRSATTRQNIERWTQCDGIGLCTKYEVLRTFLVLLRLISRATLKSRTKNGPPCRPLEVRENKGKTSRTWIDIAESEDMH